MKWMMVVLLAGCQLVPNGVGPVEPMEWEEFQSSYPEAWCDRRFACPPTADNPGYETLEDCVVDQVAIATAFYEEGCTYDPPTARRCTEETVEDSLTCGGQLTSACFAWCVVL